MALREVFVSILRCVDIPGGAESKGGRVGLFLQQPWLGQHHARPASCCVSAEREARSGLRSWLVY